MKTKVIAVLLVVLIVIFTGCTRDTEEDNRPSEIKDVEINEEAGVMGTASLSPETFMEKMAYLGVEVGKVEGGGGTGGFPELVYEGLYESSDGDIYGSYITYPSEEMATSWFEELRHSYSYFSIGVEDFVSEEAVFSVYTEEYFVGIKREGNTVLVISAGKNPEMASQVFSCFLTPNTENP